MNQEEIGRILETGMDLCKKPPEMAKIGFWVEMYAQAIVTAIYVESIFDLLVSWFRERGIESLVEGGVGESLSYAEKIHAIEVSDQDAGDQVFFTEGELVSHILDLIDRKVREGR